MEKIIVLIWHSHTLPEEEINPAPDLILNPFNPSNREIRVVVKNKDLLHYLESIFEYEIWDAVDECNFVSNQEIGYIAHQLKSLGKFEVEFLEQVGLPYPEIRD